MRFSPDWKYWLTFAIAIVSIGIPLLLWYVDKKPPSIQLKLVSLTPISTGAADSPVSGIVVSLDGVQLSDPYVSVLQFINDGSVPIASASFETPLEIRLNSEAEIVRASVESTKPADLEVQLSFDSKTIKVQPLLINPDESITITVVTSKAAPSFSPRARIVGISEIAEIDQSKTSDALSVAKGVIQVAIGAFLFFAAFFMNRLMKERVAVTFGLSLFIYSVVMGIGGGFISIGVGTLKMELPAASIVAFSLGILMSFFSDAIKFEREEKLIVENHAK